MEENQMDEGQENVPPKGNSMIWIAVVAVIVIIGIIFFSRGGNKNSATPSPNKSVESSTTDESNVKTFDISAKPFEFSIKEIKVKKGDKVKINLTVTQGMHDWVVDEFNAKINVIQAGQIDSVEFTADKTGTFEYYCSVPTHRQQGMVGKLIVE